MCGFRFANVLQATSSLSLLQGVLRCILQVYLVRLVANRIDRRGKRLRLLRDAFFGAPHRLLGAPLPHPISMAFWAPRAHCRRRPRATLGRGLVRGRRLLHMLSIPFHELVTSIGLFLVFQSHPDILEAQKVRIRLASFQQGQVSNIALFMQMLQKPNGETLLTQSLNALIPLRHGASLVHFFPRDPREVTAQGGSDPKGGRPPAFQHGIDIPNARRIEEVVVFIIGLLDSIDPGQTLYLVMIASSQIGRRPAARASLL